MTSPVRPSVASAEARVRGYLAAFPDMYNLGAEVTYTIDEAAGPYKLSRPDIEVLLEELQRFRAERIAQAGGLDADE
ncbi:hypothetical protein [Glycomyces sp. YM15]|uniref:hypothetical protein n=1 Tax=Glycomyces sp. YM15 TaxID=2800446 RepID=UPI001962841C|nr:hypothetical protein [Glycomyces sp. YM15]